MTSGLEADVSAVARIDAVPMILEVVCRTTGMGFAAVARVTQERWVTCAVRDEIEFGLHPGSELKIETTFCNQVRNSGNLVVFDHADEDEAYCGHPITRMYGIQSYISVPIFRPGGEFFGTLCAIDRRPAKLNTPETIGMFQLFAQLIGLQLDLHDRLEASEAALLDERQGAELRDQFVAVLGHDLRNPLAAIDAGAKLLLKQPLNREARSILAMMQNSVGRMAGLIDNLLDFARAQLGGGLTVSRSADGLLQASLEQVIAEMRAAWPDRTIESDLRLDRTVHCDRSRMAQLLSNLLGNALTHGAADGPVGVRASTDRDNFELSVSNSGEPIPAAMLPRLFRPFSRVANQPTQQGLGLGLYISSEIARAHGGTLDVESTADETRFTFRMPLV